MTTFIKDSKVKSFAKKYKKTVTPEYLESLDSLVRRVIVVDLEGQDDLRPESRSWGLGNVSEDKALGVIGGKE